MQPIAYLVLWVVCFAAYITHFAATWGENLALFLLGAFLPPIGIIHGFVVWIT
mgnify:CR=1 FL=1